MQNFIIDGHVDTVLNRQIMALAERNSVIGINFSPSFLHKSGKAEINDFIKHINYIKKLVGVDYIALGSDYDGIQNTPIGLEDMSCLPNLKEALYNHGYNEKEINKIFQKNWLRIFKEILE